MNMTCSFEHPNFQIHWKDGHLCKEGFTIMSTFSRQKASISQSRIAVQVISESELFVLRQEDPICTAMQISIVTINCFVQELLKEDNHELEAALGFPRFTDGENRLGWLINLNEVGHFPQLSHEGLLAVWSIEIALVLSRHAASVLVSGSFALRMRS